MPVVDAQSLVRTYGTHTVLDHVDLTIHAGQRVGLVGDNGSGKSTLGRILSGLEQADAGELHVRRGACVGYLAQAPDLPGEVSARDAVLSGLPQWLDARRRHDEASRMLEHQRGQREQVLLDQAAAAGDIEQLGGWHVAHRAEALLGHVGVTELDRAVGSMSGGEQRRVALAKLLLSAPELAILDEPTNHLDIETIEWLERYLIDTFTGAVLLITHDRYVLDRVAQRTLELSDGKLYSYQGGYDAFLEGKAERESHAARVEQNRQNFLRRELEWLRRGPKARGTKQKARVERAQAALSVAGPKNSGGLSLEIAQSRSGKTVIELHDVSLMQGDRMLISGLDLFVTKGERIGILGPNGAGKTTLLRTILGEHAVAGGRIVVGKSVEVAYLSQNRDGLDLDASILENVSSGSLVVDYGGRQMDVRGYLQLFLFDPQRYKQPVGSLSGGERTRVAIAKLLCREANLVILDEPTNDLDVSTLGALEEMLCNFGGSVLVVTHDRYFLDRVATSVLVAEGEGQWVRYAGNYSDYLSQRTTPKNETKAQTTGAKDASKSQRPKAKAALTYAQRLELESLPDTIDAAEQTVAALQAQLADPELYKTRGSEVAGLQSKLESAQQDVETLMTRWEQLELKREERA